MGRRILLLLFLLMAYGLLTENLYLIWSCIFVVFSLNSYLLIKDAIIMERTKRDFEFAHKELIEHLEALKEEKRKANEKPKIVIK
jgi:hypothetical protein